MCCQMDNYPTGSGGAKSADNTQSATMHSDNDRADQDKLVNDKKMMDNDKLVQVLDNMDIESKLEDTKKAKHARIALLKLDLSVKREAVTVMDDTTDKTDPFVDVPAAPKPVCPCPTRSQELNEDEDTLATGHDSEAVDNDTHHSDTNLAASMADLSVVDPKSDEAITRGRKVLGELSREDLERTGRLHESPPSSSAGSSPVSATSALAYPASSAVSPALKRSRSLSPLAVVKKRKAIALLDFRSYLDQAQTSAGETATETTAGQTADPDSDDSDMEEVDENVPPQTPIKRVRFPQLSPLRLSPLPLSPLRSSSAPVSPAMISSAPVSPAIPSPAMPSPNKKDDEEEESPVAHRRVRELSLSEH